MKRRGFFKALGGVAAAAAAGVRLPEPAAVEALVAPPAEPFIPTPVVGELHGVFYGGGSLAWALGRLKAADNEAVRVLSPTRAVGSWD